MHFPLTRLADRASAEEGFFAHVIAAYTQQHGLTLELLAEEWGVTSEMLARIRLCYTPADDAQAQQIATEFGIGVERVREVMGW